HGNDVRVLKLRGKEDLSLEPLDTYAGGEHGGQDLDGHRAAERALAGEEDAAHAAAKLPLDGVGVAEDGLQVRAELHPPERVGRLRVGGVLEETTPVGHGGGREGGPQLPSERGRG